MKLKAMCQHCGHKQTANEKNYSISHVCCKKCNKQGSLILLTK